MYSIDKIMDAYWDLDGSMQSLERLNNVIKDVTGLYTHFSNHGYTLNIEGRTEYIKIEATRRVDCYKVSSRDDYNLFMYIYNEIEAMTKDVMAQAGE